MRVPAPTRHSSSVFCLDSIVQRVSPLGLALTLMIGRRTRYRVDRGPMVAARRGAGSGACRAGGEAADTGTGVHGGGGLRWLAAPRHLRAGGCPPWADGADRLRAPAPTRPIR